ncbi:FMN-binding protein [Streptomyces sp. PKU-MA01144]|nr:FMN-binding protein [Streptomyces sp. PKU-MA01144]
MIAVAGTASAVALLLTLKQPGTTVAGAASQAGAPPANSAPAGSGAVPAGGATVLGDEADTQFGPVQVELTLSGGRITGARAVKVPSTDANSRKIAESSVPQLNQAAVDAQSADIDTVSGATYTSQGYIRSLQSALDKAGAAGAGEGTGQGSAPGAGSGADAPDGDVPGDGSGDVSGEGSGDGSDPGQGSGSGATESVLGDVAGTQYGDVQVRLTVSGGRITGAEAVKTPGSDANSRKIAAGAVPKLNQAAVAAQSADIDTVSGATYTSQGYIRSLQSALDKAGPAGAGEGTGQGSAPGAGSGADAPDGDVPGDGSGDVSGEGSGDGSDPGQGSGSGATESVLGDVAGTQYGDVQVRLTVSGGRITGAEAVKTPGSDANSRKIAAGAVPKLNQAAVAAQSADIDTVSGATYTSQGYIRSLQSALDKAGL